jgi:hypothetical protein
MLKSFAGHILPVFLKTAQRVLTLKKILSFMMQVQLFKMLIDLQPSTSLLIQFHSEEGKRKTKNLRNSPGG